jgi:polysaccharide export outer membrane protein
MIKRLCAFPAISLLLVASSAFAQESIAKPVLSAPPPPAPPAAAPKSSAAVPPATVNVAVDATYVIGPQDSINVDVWEEPKFSGSLTVRPDGMITLPLLGDIPAAGRTPTQLAADLTVLLKKYITDPEGRVTVSVLGINSKRVYFYGEGIGKPGPLNLTPAMTILQAIDSAGGLGPYANKKKIYVLRNVQGKQQKIFFDYSKALKTGDSFLLVPGDMIVVP